MTDLLACTALSSIALNVTWPCVADTDLYYVAIFGSEDAARAEPQPQPLAIVTATCQQTYTGRDGRCICSTVVEDVLPGRTYFVRVRSHPSTAPSLVWGWRPYPDPDVANCTTLQPPLLRLERDGPLLPYAVGLRWSHAGQSAHLASIFVIKWRQASGSAFENYRRPSAIADFGEGVPTEAWDGSISARSFFHDYQGGSESLVGLKPGTNYFVVMYEILAGTVIAVSDPVRLCTAEHGVQYDTVYRVAEGTTDIDFLYNHNGGDLVGEAAFLTDSGNFVEPASQLVNDSCAQALNRSKCHPVRDDVKWRTVGSVNTCMSCLTSLWEEGKGSIADAVRAQCSNPGLPWPGDNKVAEAFCRAGFSFFDWQRTPITEYCVRRRQAPPPTLAQRGWQQPGFAPYASCNAPEAGSRNNHTNPICICACYADRLIAMQPKSELEANCGSQRDPTHPRYRACNCTQHGGVLEPNGSSSLMFVGAMQVRCPYFYFDEPVNDYGWPIPCGLWFSFPRDGACFHNAHMLQVNCTWQTHALARNIYGPALLAAGWNLASSFVDKTGARWNNSVQTIANSRALSRAFAALDSMIKPRCCGC